MTSAADRHDIVVRMPTELHAAVKRRAAQDGVSMADTIRAALAAYIETHGTGRR